MHVQRAFLVQAMVLGRIVLIALAPGAPQIDCHKSYLECRALLAFGSAEGHIAMILRPTDPPYRSEYSVIMSTSKKCPNYW